MSRDLAYIIVYLFKESSIGSKSQSLNPNHAQKWIFVGLVP